MFLPFDDAPRARHFTAWATYALMAINIVVFLWFELPLAGVAPDPRDPHLQEYLSALLPTLPAGLGIRSALAGVTALDLFLFAHGYKPAAPELSDLFSAMFLHGDLLHLAGNMLFLWIFGRNVEHRAGRPLFVAAYLLTGVAATWIFALFAGNGITPLVGASGAISGVLGLYFLMFPRNRVRTAVILPPFFFDVVMIPARWVLGFYLVVDNLLPFIVQRESSVAYGAHLGGFVAGLGVAWLGEAWGWHLPWSERLQGMLAGNPADAGRPSEDHHELADLAALQAALATGDRARAFALVIALGYREIMALGALDCLVLARWLREGGYGHAATGLMRRYVAAHHRRPPPGLAEVALELGLTLVEEGQPAAGGQYLIAALDLEASPTTHLAARQALAALGFRVR